MPVPQSLRAQKVVIFKTTSAQDAIAESLISFDASIAEPLISFEISIASVDATLPDDVADHGSASNARTATVPTAVTRVVTVNKLVQFFLLSSASTTSLRQACGRQGRQQNQARDYQENLAIEFY